MLSYIISNKTLIESYEKLYSDGVNIKKLVKYYKKRSVHAEIFDYARFQVFLDSCLLLLNKERLNYYYKASYSFSEYIAEVEKEEYLKGFFENIRERLHLPSNISPCVFLSRGGTDKNGWDQVATIRNAFAHMQYSDFVFNNSNGTLLYFEITNTDKGVEKDSGVVFEPILHDLVKKFFSNYYFGLPFKVCFFSMYSMKRKEKTPYWNYYEIKARTDGMDTYKGGKNDLSELIKTLDSLRNIGNDEKTAEYFDMLKERYDTEEYKVEDLLDMSLFRKCLKKYRISKKANGFIGLKTFLDFDTTLSNFIVHLSQLNSVLYQRKMIEREDNTGKICKAYDKELRSLINELKEDKGADISFKIGFVYLKLMNLGLRLEKGDSKAINYAKLDVNNFNIVEENVKKYADRNGIGGFERQKYVVERTRNAIMHGHFGVEISERGEIMVIFTDKYKSRQEILSIELNDLYAFLNQDILYLDIEDNTEFIEKIG